MTIVTTTYRPKRAPRKKRPAAPLALPAIATIHRGPDVPDMAPEEHKRRGDAAEVLFREIARRVTGKEP